MGFDIVFLARPPNAPPNSLPSSNFFRSHLSLRLASPAPLGVARGLTMLPSSPPSSPSWFVGDVSQSLVPSYTFCGSVYSAVTSPGVRV